MVPRRNLIRAGIAGIGFMALPAEANTPFVSYPFQATGAPTRRTMPDRLAEVVNVKDYGAVGDGVTDDHAALQAAIDAAFGPSSSPHGTNSTANRPLFFPHGNYRTSLPLVFTKVRGAKIYGPAIIKADSGQSCIITNGMEYCRWDNIGFNSDTSVTFDLDWDGVGSVGLQGNLFMNCGFGGPGVQATYGMRIGFSGHGGNNNQFYGCNWNLCSVAGMVTWAASAIGNVVQGGGASQTVIGFWVKAGQISTISDCGLSVNTSADVQMDSDGPILLKGSRTESALSLIFNSPTGAAVLDGHSASASVNELCRTKGKAIIDSLQTDSANPNTKLCTNATYTGTVYLRGGSISQANFLVGFAGTVAQNI